MVKTILTRRVDHIWQQNVPTMGNSINKEVMSLCDKKAKSFLLLLLKLYSSLNYIGSYYKSDSLRKIMLAPLSDIKEISEIERIVKGNANAVLFILPNTNSSLDELRSLLSQAQIMLCNIF